METKIERIIDNDHIKDLTREEIVKRIAERLEHDHDETGNCIYKSEANKTISEILLAVTLNEDLAAKINRLYLIMNSKGAYFALTEGIDRARQESLGSFAEVFCFGLAAGYLEGLHTNDEFKILQDKK